MELQQENIIQSQDKKPLTSKELKCNYCAMRFAKQRDLVRHVSIIHHDDFVRKFKKKEIQCNYCRDYKLLFTDYSSLAQHVSVVHNNIRPFSCEGCKQAFASKQELIRHSEKGCKFRYIPKKKQIVKPFTQLLLQNFQNTSAVRDQPGQENLTSLFTCKQCYRSFDTSRGLLTHKTYCIQMMFCLNCNFRYSSKRNRETHICNILCSKCNVSFCSHDSLELHFNSCEGPETESLADELQITIADTFSCSNCDMDLDLKKTLKEHSENCEIAMLQPGEEHLDHTYSKKFELNEMKIEVKEENFENFEALEQVGIDHITSKDFDRPFNKSENFRMKTEFKAEVKEETIEDFGVNEQVGIDFITSKDFETPFIKSETSRMKTEYKAEVKEEAFQEFDTLSNKSDLSYIKEEIKFETDVQRGLIILEKLEYPMKIEVETDFKEETIEDFDAKEQIGIDLIINKDFNY